MRQILTFRSTLGLIAVALLVLLECSRGKYHFALLWYLLVVKLLMNHPTILHQKRTKFRMSDLGDRYSHHFIAHRGGGWHAPENTMQAFKKAVDLGCHMLEMDVRLTKDKQLIVCHDEDFKRMCSDNRKVCEVDFAELPKFKTSFLMQQHHAYG